MILLLDTHQPLCQLTLIDGDTSSSYEWQADRQLAKGLLGFIIDSLARHHKTPQDLQAIGVYRGPGSFTGLRIGLTVVNTMAQSLAIPLVGETGEKWSARALQRLEAGESDSIVLPLYDRPANITSPRK